MYLIRHSPLPIASQLLDFSNDIELQSSASATTIVNGTSFALTDFHPFLPSVDPTTFSSLLDIQLPANPTPDDLLDDITNDYGYANTGYPSVGTPPLLYDECQWFFPGIDTMVGPVAETGMAFQEMSEYPNGTVTANYSMESMQHESEKLQVMEDCQQQQPPALDLSNLEDSTFKVGRLSAEERKEKIHRYMKKRNKRNFSKKIKYACRKTLADSRPRVRGRFARFAKNEELGNGSSNNEYDEDEVVAKEEDIFDSSDILAHISGVNSFSYKYTVESWM